MRAITNSSKGKLGAKIAEAFAQSETVDKIFYLCAEAVILPVHNKIVINRISDTHDLERQIRTLLSQEMIDIVIHSMAVSDYRVKAVTTTQDIARSINMAINKDEVTLLDQINQAKQLDNANKLNSSIDGLVLLMERTPKIIALFKSLAPNSVLVGFKLMSQISHQELIDAAQRLMIENNCDFVLANDGVEIDDFRHVGYLIDQNLHERRFYTKEEIAQGLTTTIIDHLMKREKL